jgi:hypothetical protein
MPFPGSSVGTGKGLGASMSIAAIEGGTIAGATITGATVTGQSQSGGAVTALTSLSTATGSTIGLYGKTPITQPASASQGAVVATATATTTVLRAQLTATMTLANALRTALVNVGVIKGAA